MTTTEQVLCEHITHRAADLYQQLAEMVAIPTGQGYAAGLDTLRSKLTHRLKAIGCSVVCEDGEPAPEWIDHVRWREQKKRSAADNTNNTLPQPTLIARSPAMHGDGDYTRILLAGHIDTVYDPNGPFQNLTTIDNGARATGPGAVDMKGGIICALAALEALHHAEIDIAWTLLLNADEEVGSFQSETILIREARQHNIGLALEPALKNGALAIERMGSGQFMIEVQGVSAHVGREFEVGRSAVTHLATIITELAALAKPEEGMIVNVGPLMGGDATNVVPDYAACWGNVRYRDSQAGTILGDAVDRLAGSDVNGSGCSVVVHRHWNRPSKPVNDAVLALAHTARTAAEDLGQSLPFASTGGVCDGNILQHAGLPTIDTLGIRGGNLHRLDEFIEVPAIVERAQLLAVLLARLAK